MLEDLKRRVCEANLELYRKGIVIYTWGNVSEVDRTTNLVVIKPSGIPYDNMTPEDMVVVDFDGNVIEGKWKPSSDLYTHLELYKAFNSIGAITHTHSTNAVAFAQAGIDIPALGTTHADYFYGDIPCTRELKKSEVYENYELNTGKVIIETIQNSNVMSVPGVIVKNHGPFTWGKSASDAVYNAVVLEQISDMALKTLFLNKNSNMQNYILDKHYKRKHGDSAYYGQEQCII